MKTFKIFIVGFVAFISSLWITISLNVSDGVMGFLPLIITGIVVLIYGKYLDGEINKLQLRQVVEVLKKIGLFLCLWFFLIFILYQTTADSYDDGIAQFISAFFLTILIVFLYGKISKKYLE